MWIHWPVILYFLGDKNIELRSMFESTGRKWLEGVKLISLLLFWFVYRNHLMLWLLFPRYTQCGCPKLALFKEGEGWFSPFSTTHFANQVPSQFSCIFPNFPVRKCIRSVETRRLVLDFDLCHSWQNMASFSKSSVKPIIIFWFFSNMIYH